MRILYTAPNLPAPPTSGGAQRTGLLLQALRALGQVDAVLLPARLPDHPTRSKLEADPHLLAIESTDEIQKQTAGRHPFRFLGPDLLAFHQAGRHRWHSFRPLLSKIGDLQHYDLVISRYLSPACTLDLFRHPRVLIDVDDYDPDRLRQRLNHASWLKRLTLRRCLRFSEEAHRTLLPRAAHCWISNPADRRHPGLSQATALPNIPFSTDGQPIPPAPPPDTSAPPVFLMVGSLNYSANTDGADAFLRRAWPLIRAKIPHAEFHLVGGGLPKRFARRWRGIPGLRLAGFLPDLAPAYARALATVCPLLAGAGTNIKVLESAAYGRAAILTRIAHRGFEQSLPANEACLVCDDMEQMAGACIELCAAPHRAHAIGQVAKQCVDHHHTRTAFEAAVREGVRIALQHPGHAS